MTTTTKPVMMKLAFRPKWVSKKTNISQLFFNCKPFFEKKIDVEFEAFGLCDDDVEGIAQLLRQVNNFLF